MAVLDACDCASILKRLDELEAGQVSGSGKAPRKKRAPSKYNLFMKECLLQKRGESGEHKEKFKACALKYRESK